MKITFTWSNPSGYAAACWRALLAASEVDFEVLAFDPSNGSECTFSSDVLDGIPHQLIRPDIRGVSGQVGDLVAAGKPDVIFLSGWWLRSYRHLVRRRGLRHCRFVLGADTPWVHALQLVNRLRYRSFFKRVDHVLVAGERSWQHAKRLGFDEAQITRGLYGVDVDGLRACLEQRSSSPWPKRFLFAGRYVERKGISVLVAGYGRYRELALANGETPWELVCCGAGPLEGLLQAQPGIANRGFVQPHEMRSELVRAGCFVLPSQYDAWPLALVEACAAGLPVVASEACGSGVELVRDGFNGRLFATGSVEGLARTLLRMHMDAASLPTMGRRALHCAEPYSASEWARRIADVCNAVMGL